MCPIDKSQQKLPGGLEIDGCRQPIAEQFVLIFIKTSLWSLGENVYLVVRVAFIYSDSCHIEGCKCHGTDRS